MNNRLDNFLELSMRLTGFDRIQLLGTGMTESYLQTLEAILPAGLLDKLLSLYQSLSKADAGEAAVSDQILNDATLGPVARNLILLWYCGTWTKLPDQWRTANGGSPLDNTHVISADAYLAGLQWAAAGAHPAGGRQQGFAAWSLPPVGDGL